MSFIYHALIRMLVFIGLVITAGILLYSHLYEAFINNVILNSAIFGVLGVGIFYNFFNVYRIYNEQKWLDSYDRGHERFPGTPEPQILTPVSLVLNETRTNYISPVLMRSLMASVESRLDAARDISRYLIGLLIFMGLLGTFWGLSHTIGAIAGVISGIDFGAGEVKDAFSTLKQGLQSPLSGMGTAFSCSMFGLTGSLVLGFLDLQIAKTFTDFYHNLENRLTLLTKVKSNDSVSGEGHSGSAYLQSLLEQTTENMSQLQQLMRRGEENRGSVLKSIHGVSEKLTIMTDQMITHQALLKKVAQNQMDLQDALLQFTQTLQKNSQEDPFKQHMRSIDMTLTKLLEESIDGRNKGVQDIRNEIRLVARTISALASGQDVAA